jgi:DNA repair exonuclease SbcCD nuclease subunit
LVGNHDHPLRNRREHGLVAFKNLKNVQIVDEFCSFEDFDAIPYTDNIEFAEMMSLKKKDILLCHHEFLGSSYENGFYSSHGISLEGNPYKRIVSGHIHKIQEFGICKYVGAPRWMHTSDANQPRGIWLWDGKDQFQFHSSAKVVGEIIQIVFSEGEALPVFNPNLFKQVILKVTGKPKFIQEVSEKYLGKAEILANIAQNTESAVSEALGVNEALKKFILQQYKIQFSDLTNEALLKEVVNRLNECSA